MSGGIRRRRRVMNSTKKTARIAGLLYLVNGVTGFFGIIYVLPRILGVLLIAAGFGYLANGLTPLLLPNYEDVVGRTRDNLVAFDYGRKGPATGSGSIK